MAVGSVMQVVRISAGEIAVEVVPEMGGGLASFDLAGQPLFRRWESSAGPFNLAGIVMLPWSNRVSGGGFEHNGTFHPLEPNVAEPFPLHGNGFQLAWNVADKGLDFVELTVDSEGPGPYRYRATLRYSVSETGLRMDLSIINKAEIALPFGLGFHPWLVRTPRTMLTSTMREVWLEDVRYLPDKLVPIAEMPQWDFAAGKNLPGGWINNAFSWPDRTALVEWPELDIKLEISASPQLNWAIIYSPSQDAEFFCFEPVTHPVDAYWLPGGASANGMPELQPGQSLHVWAHFGIVG